MGDQTSEWVQEVREAVEERLERFFAEKLEGAEQISPEAGVLGEQVRSLTLRGGKRLRALLLVAGYRAIDGSDANSLSPAMVDAACALELLQSYLLIHDDWMDGDERRRGGPAAHAALRDAHEGDAHLGASLAILAGNLGCTWAWELLISAGAGSAALPTSVLPTSVLPAALAIFSAMQEEVLYGQQLDLCAHEDVALMQQLKTGSYTVRGPLRLGAALAGASEEQQHILLNYAQPLGEAFQMRDDLLGTFGDPSATGKPSGGDLRAGKNTALIGAARESATPQQWAAIEEVLGDMDATDIQVSAATEVLAICGARARVERRLTAHLEQARAALAENSLLKPEGARMLMTLVDMLALRDH